MPHQGQAIVAQEELVPNEEGRHPEGAAPVRFCRGFDQCRFRDRSVEGV
jgi:hypothetical protein